MSVYKAINSVQRALAKEGIGKGRRNEQQGYAFRGIDDVYNALAPILAANGLCILPRCTERNVVERVNAKGTALFYVTVRAEFDFVASEDGSKHTVVTYGEAMDSGDKATNKAMSAAYKYACMQAFSIPTEGDNDADATTHEVAAADPLAMFPQHAKAQIIKSAQAAIAHFREGNEWGAYEELTSCAEKLGKGDATAANQVKLALASIYGSTPNMKAAIRALAEREHSKATA